MKNFKRPVSLRANDMMINDGFAFLEKELEKVDAKLLEPLDATLWPRDMPVKTGGGFIENVAAIDVSYASTGGENGEGALMFDNANDIPVIQADCGKTIWRVFNWGQAWTLSFLQKEKFKKTARNAEEVLNKGIHKYFDHFCDQNVYKGFSKVSSTGLINNPNVTRVTADPHTSGGSDTTWDDKTPDEILADINRVLTSVWAANEMAENALPNHILIPTEQFGSLVTRKVGTTGDKSILTYIKENNITTQQGKDLVIAPCKYCKGAGTSSSDRLVAYINNQDMIEYEMTAPLQRVNTQQIDMSFKTYFAAQISEVKFKYPTTVYYMDGI